MAASPCLKAFMLPGGPLLPLTPPLPGMPAITALGRDDFRLFYQSYVRLFTVKNIRTSFGQSQKIEIDKALTLEHYIYNKVFVSPLWKGTRAFLRSSFEDLHNTELGKLRNRTPVPGISVTSMSIVAGGVCCNPRPERWLHFG